MPEDFAAWCLRQAVEAATVHPKLACELLVWSRPWHEGHSDKGLSIEEVRAATEPFPVLRRQVGLLATGRKASPEERQLKERVEEYRRKEHREEARFIAHVREHVAELKAATCSPRLLHEIAVQYHGFFGDDRDSSPKRRVAKLMGEDVHLTEAALGGFRRVIERDDLPTLREIIRLDERNMISLLALPILAGFDLVDAEALKDRGTLGITRAAGLHYLTRLNVEGHPTWYREALRSHPESVAEALIKVTRSRIRRREDCLYLWHLGRDKAHEHVARLAAPRLLRAFPTRCTEPQVSALQELLLAAIRWKAEGLEDLVRQRAAKSDLDVAQRALWLAANLFLSPERGVSRLVEFVEGGEEARSRHVVGFLAPPDMDRPPMPWGSGELRKLIALLGSHYTPWRPELSWEAVKVDEERTKAEGLIAGWAATLASRTDRGACEALQALLDDAKLEAWHFLLRERRDGQILARRSRTFTVADLGAVQATLANEVPASPADLAALVVDTLEKVAVDIHRGNADAWRQYWNEDARRRPSDDHAIPVEIKKDSHRRLWSGVEDQLARKYTIDPESSGFGVYLVLWFGRGRVPVPPTGRRPRTPEALRERLEAQLHGPNRHAIKVAVIDVSGSAPASPLTGRSAAAARAEPNGDQR